MSLTSMKVAMKFKTTPLAIFILQLGILFSSPPKPSSSLPFPSLHQNPRLPTAPGPSKNVAMAIPTANPIFFDPCWAPKSRCGLVTIYYSSAQVALMMMLS